MNIQLFNPPSFHYEEVQFKMLPTLGLPILAAVLNKAGHHTEVVDLEAKGVRPRQLREAFSRQLGRWPDVVGFTGLNGAARGIRECIAELRAAGFTGRIIAGGAYATLNPQAVSDWGADLVVTGEAEGNIVSLLELGATGIQAGKAAPIEDIPAPAWDYFTPDLASYYGNMAMLRPNPGITMWTRGCPYQCVFCSNLIFNHRPTRYRPPANIEAEMQDLKRRGVKRVYVYDDELVGTKMPDGWMSDVADRVGPMDFQMVTQGRCSFKFITPKLLADVKRSGIHTIFWGVESFSQKVLDAMNKHTSTFDIWYTLRAAKEAGIKNGLFMMIGNYQETDEDAMMTAEGLERAFKEGLVDYRQSTVCTVMEGTELETIQKREGWYKQPEYSGRDLRKAYGTPWLSASRIDYWQSRIQSGLSGRDTAMKRAIVSFGTNKHAELLDISFPTFKAFGDRHGWDVYRADNIGKGRPAPWYKVQALINLLNGGYDEALFLGADTIIVDGREDLIADDWSWQALVQHHTGDGLVPNTDVWLCRKEMLPWLDKVWNNLRWLMHGWWEQASLMDLMGFHVEQPTYLKLGTELYMSTYFLDQSWNVHKWHKPATEHPRIQHATMWPDRVAIMQEWRREADGWMNE